MRRQSQFEDTKTRADHPKLVALFAVLNSCERALEYVVEINPRSRSRAPKDCASRIPEKIQT